MSRRLVLVVLAAAAVAVACITINVYFPEAAVKDLSLQIEEEIANRAGATAEETLPAEPTATPSESAPVPPQASALGWPFGASVAWAAEEEVPSPGITNPAIRAIIESRAKRLEALNRFKAAGVLGEAKTALVEIRDLARVTDLRERAEVQRLVRDENADRQQLFKEVAIATDVDPSQIERIQETYAETMRDKARPGDWVQQPDGKWVQKAE